MRFRAMNPRRLVKEKLRVDSPPASKNAGPAPETGRRAPLRPLRLENPMIPVLSRLPKIVLVAALAAAGAGHAWAQEPPRGGRGNDGPPRGMEQGQPRARGQDELSDSVRRFERSNRGSRVLSAERMQSDGRDVNRIKAMDDRGRVRVYVDDPQRQRSEPQRRPPARDDDG